MARSKKILIVVLLVIVGLLLLTPTIVGLILQGPEQPQGETSLRFNEIETEFTHRSDFEAALPFMALSMIDRDNDGVDEVFVGGGDRQQDALLAYRDGGLRAVDSAGWFDKADGDPTYGAASIDGDGDGRTDLYVARNSGLYFYRNTGDGFAGQRIDFPLDEKSLPLSVSFGDVNRDGAVDLFVSNYVRPEFVEGETIFNQDYGAYSNLLLNDGNHQFTDITDSAGIRERHNTFNAVFVDLDNDAWSDLVVAQDTGFVRIFRNQGDGTFADAMLKQDYAYPMGIAVSDVNNDGLMDLYFSNAGDTLPESLLRGDLRDDQVLNRDYIMLENQGGMQFKDIARARNAADYPFGWGLVSADFNNDTRADYLVTQNYVRFPFVEYLDLFPGNLLQQYPDGQFRPVESVAGIANDKFGVTTAISDFNQDGWPDAVIANLGDPLRAFINAGGDNRWLKLRFADSAKSIGTRVRVELNNGQTLHGQFYTSVALGSDSTREMMFGLGDAGVRQIVITPQQGEPRVIDQPTANSVVDVQ